MDEKEKAKLIAVLNEALETEMAVMARYLHHSFLVFGPGRGPIVGMFRSQAKASMEHAVELGEKIAAFGGHPSIDIHLKHEKGDQSTEQMLREDLANERASLEFYKRAYRTVSVDLPLKLKWEQILIEEQEHVDELEKLLRKE